MATRQGIALGPLAQTYRNTTGLFASTGYVTPIPGGSNFLVDANGLATNIARSTVIYGYQHLALKRIYEVAVSHYHSVTDYYQVPTYGGAYGNLGYNDSNGGAGDRNAYGSTVYSGYPRYGIVFYLKGIPIVSYLDMTYPLSLPISNFSRGLRIYRDDYEVLRTGIIELMSHSHLINDRTSA
jgi:hypothetical protein